MIAVLGVLLIAVLIVVWGVLSLEKNPELEWLTDQYGLPIETLARNDGRFMKSANGEWVFRDSNEVNWKLVVREGALRDLGYGTQVEIEVSKDWSESTELN